MTHGIRYLPQCDYIAVMSDGTITEMGTYAELAENDGPFTQFLNTYQTSHKNEEEEPGN